jgi:hypothetical protein
VVERTDDLPDAPTRVADFEDDFSTPLRADLWVGHYLPQWTTPDRSAARYESSGAGLRLRIDDDQLDWRAEDAPMRVSNIQTGTFSGDAGSRRGTHRYRRDGLTVRTPTATRLLWAPCAGRVDLTVSASRDDDCMLAGWLIGTEHLAEENAGEVCVFEIDAAAIGETESRVRCGVRAHHDPRLTTDMAEMAVSGDLSLPHTWTVIWGNGETIIGCDGAVLRHIAQAPDYPLFLMIDLFEIGQRTGNYPKTATIHRVRGWTQ